MGICCSELCISAEDRYLEGLVGDHLAFFQKAETFFAANPGEQWIPIAVAQYAVFLQQRAAYQHENPPPFAVAWIWHLHLLHPVAYKTYCESKFLRVLSPLPGDMLLGSLELLYTLEAQPDIPLPMTRTETAATWTELHLKQKTFFSKTKAFAPSSSQLIRLISKFKRFLQLMNLSNGILVPTLEIDYIWHSCLRSPLFYYDLCQLQAGKFIDHNDLFEDGFLRVAFKETKALYESQYPEFYETCTWGAVASGAPESWFSCAGVRQRGGGGECGGCGGE